MVTVSLIPGSSDWGRIVCTPDPLMLNTIVSGPGLALASRIAWRNEPGPLSAVVTTAKVAACSDGTASRKTTNRIDALDLTRAGVVILTRLLLKWPQHTASFVKWEA